MSAIEKWKSRVESHHAQSIRAMGDSWSPGDFWRPFARNFRDDPRRTDDPIVDRLVREVDSSTTVLDVGGGAGRLALPLALHSAHATVLEPSDSMLEQLREVMEESGIENVSSIQGNWEDTETEPADIVLCSHVVYGVTEIELFLRKLTTHARKRVLLLAFVDSPQAHHAAFWKAIHGEERVNLPGLPEIVNVLWEMDIYPDIEMLEASVMQTFDDFESAINQLRLRLYVMPDTEQDERLRVAAKQLLVETSDGLIISGARPRRPGLLLWGPE